MWFFLTILILIGILAAPEPSVFQANGMYDALPSVHSFEGQASLHRASSTRIERNCYDDTFCVESVEENGRVDLFVSKLVPWDFTLVIDLELENMTSNQALPVIRSFATRGREQIMTLTISRPQSRWAYRFNLKWVVGSLQARHDDQFVYVLPFKAGRSFLVSQGPNGSATHQGKFAVDFEMPTGTEVRAARDGVVVEVEESYRKGKLDPSLKSQANFVKIRHSDGTIGHYVHLMQNGVRVYKGDRIRAGGLIGYSGDTGYSSGPHLHFEVYTISKSLQAQTIPIRFRANGRNGAVPREGVTLGH